MDLFAWRKKRAADEEKATVLEEKIREIELEKIAVNPFQPRRQFSQEELEELATSIKSIGLIQPPVVKPLANGYELISGERRLRAAELAGLKTIKVLIRESSHSQSAQAALIENVQRVDLNPMEIAHSLKNLIEQFGFDQETLAEQIGKQRSTVANYLRLLALPTSIQEGLSKGTITMGHAKAILSLNGEEKQHLLYNEILREKLNVRQAENAVSSISKLGKKRRGLQVGRNIYLEQVQDAIQQKIGTKVSIQEKGKGGAITLVYYDLDDLDRLLEFFAVKTEIE